MKLNAYSFRLVHSMRRIIIKNKVPNAVSTSIPHFMYFPNNVTMFIAYQAYN